MMLKKKNYYLWLILLLAAFLRFWQLGQLPTILNRDEAALAYNAALVVATGQDEWQRSWPLTFQSFGDYKLPGYIYSLVALFRFLPEQDWLVRLPSALAGVFLVYLAYLWAKNILKLPQKYALTATGVIAVLPIFTFYSRIAFEANVALSLFTAALYLLLQKKKLVLAVALLILALLFYNSAFLLLPFLILYFLAELLRSYKERRKTLLFDWLSLFALALIFLLAAYFLLSLSQQKSGITIFSDATTWAHYVTYRESLPDWLLPIAGSKYIYYLGLICSNFLSSFSWPFLVTNGGSHPWHSPHFWGHLFVSTYVLALLGLIFTIFNVIKQLAKKKWPQLEISFLYLLIISLLPAAITVDAPHATRSLFFFFLLTLLAVRAVEQLLSHLSPPTLKLASGILCLTLVLEATFYHLAYFRYYRQLQPDSLWPNYRNLISWTMEKYPGEKIAVLDQGGYQYIVTAWYLKMPATEFFQTLEKLEPDAIQFSYGARLGNFHFIRDREDLTDEDLLLSQGRGLEKL